MRFNFGSGRLFVVPTAGNLPTNPTARAILTLQECSVDISQTLVELKGMNKVADDVAPGEMKVSGKVTTGRNDRDLFNQIMFADTRSTGIKNIIPAESGTVTGVGSPVTSGTYQVSKYAGFVADLGVIDASTGLALVRTTGVPTSGQYSVSSGTYTFAAGAVGSAMLFSYVETESTTGFTVAINNQLQGYGPIFELWLGEPYNAVGTNIGGIHLYACRVSKLNQAAKQGAYTIPEFDYQAFANAAGQVGEFFDPNSN